MRRLPDAPPRRTLPKPDPAPPAVKDRPKCPTCGKRRRPSIVNHWSRVPHDNETIDGRLMVISKGFTSEITSRSWEGAYEGAGLFCKTRCAITFANAAYRAGCRVKGSDS